MQLHVKGKNLEVSDSIRKYVERKVGKLDRQLSRRKDVEVEVEIELAVERNPSIAENQVAEAIVRLKGHTLRAREASSDMKASIDELIENLVRQVREERDKQRSARKTDKQALIDPESSER
ncbi:MAG TPA: ribosome-associated translation inhibitor RaiA [Gaiellaceae bacterium]